MSERSNAIAASSGSTPAISCVMPCRNEAGFVREGLMRRSAVKEGRVMDQVLYAFISEEPAPEGVT